MTTNGFDIDFDTCEGVAPCVAPPTADDLDCPVRSYWDRRLDEFYSSGPMPEHRSAQADAAARERAWRIKFGC